MGAKISTPSIEVEVLSPSEKGRITAEMMWAENPDKKLPEMSIMLSEAVSDPVERQAAIETLLKIHRGKLDDFLTATDFDETEVIGAINNIIEERDSGVGATEGAEGTFEIAEDEVA